MWEPLYKKFSSYLDIPNRIEILNKRLDILKVSQRPLQWRLALQPGWDLHTSCLGRRSSWVCQAHLVVLLCSFA